MLLLFNGLAGSRLEKRMAVDEASTLNFAGFGTACPTPVTDVIFTEKAASQNSNRKWVEHEMAQFGLGLEPALSQLSQKHSNAPGCQVSARTITQITLFICTIQHHPAPSSTIRLILWQNEMSGKPHRSIPPKSPAICQKIIYHGDASCDQPMCWCTRSLDISSYCVATPRQVQTLWIEHRTARDLMLLF